MKHKELALALKLVDLLTVAGCLALLVIVVPIFAAHADSAGPGGSSPFAIQPLVSRGAAFVLWLPILVMGINSWKMFTRIGNNNSFCPENTQALRSVSVLSLFECVLLALAGVACLVTGIYSYGLLALIVLLMFICLALSAISAALSHLTLKATSIQDENDLTV